MTQAQLQGTILRFGALWLRILDAWFDGEKDAVLPEELEEAVELRSRLDVPGMTPSYERLNPAFALWLATGGATPAK